MYRKYSSGAYWEAFILKIRIRTPIKPFSHTPGERFLIPGSNIVAQPFPEKVVLFSLDSPEDCLELVVAMKGPTRGFTSELNLEKGCLTVFGKGINGFFRNRLQAVKEGILWNDQLQTFKTYRYQEVQKPLPHLSLGSRKKQEWEGIVKRRNFLEYLPILHRMHTWTPSMNWEKGVGGSENLLKNLNWETLEAFFLTAFQGMFVPSLNDPLHQGILFSEAKKGISPRFLLSEAAYCFEKKFLLFEKGTLKILSDCPSKVPCGKFLHFQVGDLGKVAIEWSKGLVRRVVFQADTQGDIVFAFQKNVRAFRLRGKKRERRHFSCSFQAGEIFSFDNFKK